MTDNGSLILYFGGTLSLRYHPSTQLTIEYLDCLATVISFIRKDKESSDILKASKITSENIKNPFLKYCLFRITKLSDLMTSYLYHLERLATVTADYHHNNALNWKDSLKYNFSATIYNIFEDSKVNDYTLNEFPMLYSLSLVIEGMIYKDLRSLNDFENYVKLLEASWELRPDDPANFNKKYVLDGHRKTLEQRTNNFWEMKARYESYIPLLRKKWKEVMNNLIYASLNDFRDGMRITFDLCYDFCLVYTGILKELNLVRGYTNMMQEPFRTPKLKEDSESEIIPGERDIRPEEPEQNTFVEDVGHTLAKSFIKQGINYIRPTDSRNEFFVVSLKRQGSASKKVFIDKYGLDEILSMLRFAYGIRDLTIDDIPALQNRQMVNKL